MKMVIHVVLFFILFIASFPTLAYPLCLKKEVLYTASLGTFSPKSNIDDYEVCPWYMVDIKKILEELQAINNAKIDYYTSALTFLIGERLQENVSDKDKEKGRAYRDYSFELAFKHRISAEEHLAIFERE